MSYSAAVATDQDDGTWPRRDSEVAIRDFAHEVRTPLSALLGYCELIRGECATQVPDVAKIDRYASTVQAAGEQLLKLCDHMMSAPERALAARIEPVDVREVMERIVMTFSGVASRRGISLDLRIAANFPKIASDPVLLGEILTNLVSNALKFTPTGGQVELRAELNAKRQAVILVVSDTGAGVPDVVLAQIRAGKRVTTPSLYGSEGWGRGIVITRQLCALLNTELDVAQRRTGGTVMSFRQPLA